MSTNTEKCCDASNNDKANSLFSKGHSISCSKICSITWVLGFEIAIFLVKIFMCIVDFSISWGKTSEYNGTQMTRCFFVFMVINNCWLKQMTRIQLILSYALKRSSYHDGQNNVGLYLSIKNRTKWSMVNKHIKTSILCYSNEFSFLIQIDRDEKKTTHSMH